jgi:hypothetical protein
MKNEWSLKSYNESVLFEEAYEKGKLEDVQVADASLEVTEEEKDDSCGYNCENCASRH